MPRSPMELPLTPRMWEVVQGIRQGKSYARLGKESDPAVSDKTIANIACRAAERLPGEGKPQFKILSVSEKQLKKARAR